MFYALRLTTMPLTPIHCSVAYLTNRWKPQLSLPPLLVSSMVSDLEIPVLFLMTGGLQTRLVLHSLLGIATIGTFLSVLLTVFLYPPIVSFFFKLDKKRIEERCRFSGTLVISCIFGGLLHVFVDSMTHEFNPVLYPFVNESFDAFRLTNDWVSATLIVDSSLLALLIFFFVHEIRKGTKNLWMRMLVG
ncbi:MAG: DUF4184 family protein [Candidatus Bathyarchaeia archaeon]